MRWHPRWFAHLWARLFGYFWIPCPVCGEEFGGQETGLYALPEPGTNGMRGWLACRKRTCQEVAVKAMEEAWRLQRR